MNIVLRVDLIISYNYIKELKIRHLSLTLTTQMVYIRPFPAIKIINQISTFIVFKYIKSQVTVFFLMPHIKVIFFWGEIFTLILFCIL